MNTTSKVQPLLPKDDFSYALTTDMNVQAAVKLIALIGYLPKPTLAQIDANPLLEFYITEKTHQFYVTVDLYSRNKPLFLPASSNFASVDSVSIPDIYSLNGSASITPPTRWSWNQWIHLPRNISDLPLDSNLVFTVWDSIGPGSLVVVGTSTLALFDSKGLLQRGTFRIPLLIPSSAQSVAPDTDSNEYLDNLQKTLRKYEVGDLCQVEWLDTLVLEKVRTELLNDTIRTRSIHLTVQLPRFDLFTVYAEPVINKTPSDPEFQQENLVEAKHRQLARSYRTGYVDRNLKPNTRTRDMLMTLVASPPTRALLVSEMDMLWNYRFYLAKDKHALTKFLKAITWSDTFEAGQALDLMHAWARPDLDDALELLGPEFDHPTVRAYAVHLLAVADDDELSMYLLQLVQALKFEVPNNGLDSLTPRPNDSLVEFLLSRAVADIRLGTLFYWYVSCECHSKVHGALYKSILQQFQDRLSPAPETHAHPHAAMIARQVWLVGKLTEVANEIRLSKDGRDRKIVRLRELLSDPKNGLVSFEPLVFPLDPAVRVVGIIPGRARVFKSSLMPLLLVFACDNGSEYPIIYKIGDDLRQDQLVIQIVRLMDKLLQKENLNLQVTPYKVLATGPDQGFVQYIPSSPLATVLQENNGMIQPFLRKHNADDSSSSSYGISANAMDTYIRSCAGYCVITYLLGVGDRHLDNLLLTAHGHLFHIDFGYILGRDPKPFPPPMKLCKEMVEAMGGANSVHFQRFQSYAFVAFSNLRRSANLILNLLNLMVAAEIPDIALEPDKAVVKVQDKFALEHDEDAAARLFNAAIDESVNALFPQVMETIHKWAQYWRK